MEIVREIEKIRDIAKRAKRSGQVVGLVPTMGFFHEGHLQLMRRARSDCDVVVVTIFVNPTQFGPGGDFDEYPRDFERDRALLEGEKVDYLFVPSAGDMYPEGFATQVEVEGLSGVMCGAERPGHFRGVTTVVAKLFNVVPADRAYFGQKDAQQLVVIRRMASDLNFPIEIEGVPTAREHDGLAMSSRNTYLGVEERQAATALFRSLSAAESLIVSGVRDAEAIRGAIKEVLSSEPLVNIEYIAICDNIYLRPMEKLSGEVLVAIAARVGAARLIDNMVFKIE